MSWKAVFPYINRCLDIEVAALQLVRCTLAQHTNIGIALVGKIGVMVSAVVGGRSVAVACLECQLPRQFMAKVQCSLSIDIPLMVKRIGAIKLHDRGALLVW